MTKYHISPDNIARPCSAQNKCHYGYSDTEHYETEQEANEQIEKILQEEYGQFTTHYKKYNSTKTLMKQKEKLYNAPEIKSKDAEECRKTPFYIVDIENVSEQKVTQINPNKNTLSFYGENQQHIGDYNRFDTLLVSEKSITEIL